MKKQLILDNESTFLAEVLKHYTQWTRAVIQMRIAGEDSTREQQYATAYRLLLSKFSAVED